MSSYLGGKGKTFLHYKNIFKKMRPQKLQIINDKKNTGDN